MGPGEGAGVVDIGDNQAVVFKVESHNHPSAIEPYQVRQLELEVLLEILFQLVLVQLIY